jgi:hypothetical protein
MWRHVVWKMFTDVWEERAFLVRMFRICWGSEDRGTTIIRNVDNIYQIKRRYTQEEKSWFKKKILKSNHQSKNNTSQNVSI